MDAYEATRVVFSRIQTLDPENAAKIMGLLLIQDHGEKEMIRLAFGPETLLQSVIVQARKELGIVPSSNPGTPTSVSTGPSPFLLSRQNSASRLPSPLSVSSPSWAPPPPVFSRSNSCNGTMTNGTVEELQHSDELMSPASPFFPSADLIDELQLQEQLSFLNEQTQQNEFLDYAGAGHHRRSYSVSDICFAGNGDGLGWKPCLYFARGYCKNGTSCRFVHGLPDESSMLEQELLLRSKSQRLMAASNGFPFSPTGSMPASPSGSNKCLNFFLQQQNENQRAVAAAAAALMLGGDEAHKFIGRSRLDRLDYMSIMNPGSRQIYLTFPADSTFREEDVSNYFSIYGPVQDVRIPYQQKRMFGFVTFIYPETVKLILAKGNPHFICDARVLVKPYKEKGKIPEKYRTKPLDRGDFSGCTTPTGLDSRDPFDLQQLGARMLHANNNTEMMIRRKLEEQQQAAELQQAIELQSRRLMGLQFLDLKSRGTISSPNGNGNGNGNSGFSSAMAIGSPTMAPIVIGTRSNSVSPDETRTEGKSPEEGNSLGTVNSNSGSNADKEESTDETSPNADSDFQESSVEHNLPDSPFASPKGGKNSFGIDIFTEGEITTMINGKNGNNGHLLGSPLLSPASSLDLASSKSCSPADRDGLRSWAIGM